MRTRNVFAALAGLVLMTGSAAYAADMPVKAPPPPPPAPVYNWTGFYLGVNLGGIFPSSSNSFSGNSGGVIGGGTVGAQWVSNTAFLGGTGILLGFEGDFNGTSLDNDATFITGAGAFNASASIPWLATARGRLGIVNGPWLVYGTGGGAWVNFKGDITGPGGGTVSADTTRSGWTAGGGVEWMFLPRWSAKLEYLFVSVEDNDLTLLGETFSAKNEQNIVRVGLNYHF